MGGGGCGKVVGPSCQGRATILTPPGEIAVTLCARSSERREAPAAEGIVVFLCGYFFSFFFFWPFSPPGLNGVTK